MNLPAGHSGFAEGVTTDVQDNVSMETHSTAMIGMLRWQTQYTVTG